MGQENTRAGVGLLLLGLPHLPDPCRLVGRALRGQVVLWRGHAASSSADPVYPTGSCPQL